MGRKGQKSDSHKSEETDFDDEFNVEDDTDDTGKVEDWERRYKGLQTSSGKKQAAMKRKIQELTDQLGEADERYETDMLTAKTEKDTLTEQLTTTKKANKTLLSEKVGRDKRDKVVDTIRSSKDDDGNPRYTRQMVELHEEGLMPSMENLEGDELLAKLDTYRDKLALISDLAVEKELDGTTPQPPGSGSNRGAAAQTPDQMYGLLMSGKLDPDGKDYADLEERYFTALGEAD